MTITTDFTGAEGYLHQAASAQAGGLTDFGDPGYLTGLRVLLGALDTDTEFSPVGRGIILGSLTAALAARLQAVAGFNNHPDCLRQPINRPLIIIGLPRTGTTALHKVLSLDPQFQGIEFWLANAPMARPPRASWPDYPAYRAAVAELDQMAAAMPDLAAHHDVSADGVDECLQILKQTFVSNNWPSSWRIPSYDAWWRQQDEGPSYDYYARVLKLIGANDPGKPWLLKNPGHVWALDALLAQFPDARIVQTHRDPAKIIPSLCSLLLNIRSMMQAGPVDLNELGERECSLWLEATRRVAAVRERHSGPVVDVCHRDFHRDPLGVINTLYQVFDLELAPEVEDNMRRWLRDNPDDKGGRHQYSAEQFGLSDGLIRERFSAYIQQFDL